MQKTNLKKLFVLLLFLPISCATKPPDKPLCKELSITRGYCVNMISGKEFEVDEVNKFEGKTWWELRISNLQVPSSTWKSLKAYLIKTCKKYGSCDKEVASWERTLEMIDQKVEPKVTLP